MFLLCRGAMVLRRLCQCRLEPVPAQRNQECLHFGTQGIWNQVLVVKIDQLDKEV